MHMRENIRPPIFKDPDVSVRILSSIFVRGVAAEIGALATMTLSEAQGLRNSTPPSVEIL